MSGNMYDNIASSRVNSSQEKLHHHHHHHHNQQQHHPRISGSQRKWRVLLPIALLLPALAAIIGIVAWTISIEVTNGPNGNVFDSEHQSSHLHHTRKHNNIHHTTSTTTTNNHNILHHKINNQQANHLEAKQSAQPLFLQFRRQQQQSHQQNDQPKSESNLPNLEQEDDAAPVAARLLASSASNVPDSANGGSVGGAGQSLSARLPIQNPASQPILAGSISNSESILSQEKAPLVNKKRRKTTGGNKKTISESIIGNQAADEAVGFSAKSSAISDNNNSNSNSNSNNEQDDDDEDQQKEQGSSLLLTSRKQVEALSGSMGQRDLEGEQQASSSLITQAPSIIESSEDVKSVEDSPEDSPVASGDASENYEDDHKQQQQNQRRAQMLISEMNRNGNKPFRQTEKRWRRKLHSSSSKAPLASSATTMTDQEPAVDNGQRADQAQDLVSASVSKPAAGSSSPVNMMNTSRQKQLRQNKAIKYIIVGGANNKTPASSGVSQKLKVVQGAESAESDGDRTIEAMKNHEEEADFKSVGGDGDGDGDKEKDSRKEVENKKPTTSGAGGSDDDEQLSFEAIASAISTSLSKEHEAPVSGNKNVADKTETTIEEDQPAPIDSSASRSILRDGQEMADTTRQATDETKFGSRRSRTTGEHLAEVIDHIVERRKQDQSSVRGGPQIVVVAPVGGTDSMKARALTKEAEPTAEIKDKKDAKSLISKKVDEIKKKEATLGTGIVKKSHKPLGARLLGTLGDVSANDAKRSSDIKYSERVEVIEDDDSSALLMKALPESADELSEQLSESHKKELQSEHELDRREQKEANRNDLKKEQISMIAPQTYSIDDLSSIHVSSHSGEARSRSPRHGLPPGLAFERYAPMSKAFVATSTLQQQRVLAASKPAEEPKLYSAEQLIREHVMRSKSQLPVSESKLSVRPINPQQVEQQQQQSQPHPEPEKKPKSQNVSSPVVQNTQQKPEQQVKAVPTTIRPIVTHAQNSTPPPPQQQQLEPQVSRDIRQQPADIQSIRVPLFSASQFQAGMSREPMAQADSYQVSESAIQQQQQRYPMMSSENQHEYHQQPALPLFADQEYNVPAHMADTVIQDIQRSPSTINMVNGQPTLISSAGQVPHQHQQQFNHMQQQQNIPQAPQMAQQASQQQQQVVAWNPQVAASSQRQQMMLAAARQMVAIQQYNQQQQQLHHQRSMRPHQQQQQILANRAGSQAPEPAKEIAAIPARRGLGHPIAQYALRHLFQSLGAQAAEQEAQHQRQHLQSRSMAPTNTIKMGASDAPQQGLSSAIFSQDQMMTAASNDPTAAQRQMRSVAGSMAQQQQMVADQDVQESSYGGGGGGGGGGYHMPPSYGGGGGGYGGGNHYESDNDKKSKGITFHFGGGPIGGGTQLITSPMGIFKHLMIPLLPNPRVNLNGKVVFGVVLEKTTAFGEPKKKYKFWG